MIFKIWIKSNRAPKNTKFRLEYQEFYEKSGKRLACVHFSCFVYKIL